MGNDFDKARFLLEPLRSAIKNLRTKDLKDVLWKNQNQPPQGEADGSFTTEQWTTLRGICESIDELTFHFMGLE